MKILILGGDNSPEREVSLRSAKAVAKAARTAGFDVVEADPKDGLEFLDKLPQDTIVFPILHGAGGEDGVIQKELEARNLPFLGSDSKSSGDCFDKWTTRLKLQSAGIQMPKGSLVDKENYKNDELYQMPHVLKVNKGGSSIGTMVVRNTDQIDQTKVDEIFKLDKQAVIEQLIEGKEVTVPILGNSALPVIEIIPPTDGEFDYENKYNGQSAELCPPENVSEEVQKNVQKIAEQVHSVMGCRHLSRVDIMLDKQNYPFVLEINTIPGLTDQSLFPKSAKQAGIDMPGLIKRFVGMVKRDYSI